MNVSQRSEENFGESVSDVIRVGSIAIAIYECVSSVSCQLLLWPFANAPPTVDGSYFLTLPAEYRLWKSQLRRSQIRLVRLALDSSPSSVSR